MSSKRRRKPSLQTLFSRKQRKMIITKSRLMNIAIQVAAFGLIKRSLTFNNNTSWHSCHGVFSFHFASFASLFYAFASFCVCLKVSKHHYY